MISDSITISAHDVQKNSNITKSEQSEVLF